MKQNHPDLGLPNQGVPQHAVEAVTYEVNPPAQEMQEVPTLRTDSTITPKHAVEAVVKNNPPAQEMQEVHTLGIDSKCEPSTKGSILENKMTEEENPIGGVSATLGEQPAGETVPKHRSTGDEDSAGGVSHGSKFDLPSEETHHTVEVDVHSLPTPFASEACDRPKGTIQKHHRAKHINPSGGVSVRPGEKPVREFVPKCQDVNDEDFAGGVPKGAAKVTLQARDSPKTSGDNPKI